MTCRLVVCACVLPLALSATGGIRGAMAQTPEADRQREYYRELDRQREEQQRRAQEEMQRQERRSAEESKRRAEADDDSRKNVEQWRKDASARGEGTTGGQSGSDMKAARARLLKMAPLPDARNPLLGRWRVEGAGRARKKDDLIPRRVQ